MDYQRFIELLPDLYENWGQESVRPKSNQFQQVLEQVGGMTTANLMQLLNFAVDCIESDEVYCEVGYIESANLIAAISNHSTQVAYAADNLSEFDTSEDKFEKILEDLSAFNLEEQVFFCNQNFEEFLLEVREIDPRISVYFYHGHRDYRSQMLGLLLVRPLLAERSLIIVGNSNGSTIQQANWDFIAAHPECQMLLDFPTPTDSHFTFWNGIQILSWDASRNYNYSFSDIKRQHNEIVIKTLKKLQIEVDSKKEKLDEIRREAITLDDYGCYEEAEKKYKELLDWNKNQPEILFNLAIIYDKMNRHQQALSLLLNCLELEPSKAIHHYSIGVVLEKIGTITQVTQAYQQAISLDPQWINAYNNLGNILLKAGEIEQAESVYRAAIAANPNHFGSYLNLGNVLMKRRQLDGAIETYEKALDLKPRNSDVIYNLAVAFDAKNDPRASLYYGYAYYRRGQHQSAIEHYQQFLETQTGDVKLYMALANCYQKLNLPEATIKSYKEGIKLYPQAAELYFYLAIALQEFGRTEEAIAVANEGSKIIPDSVTLKLVRQYLLPIIYETETEIDYYRSQFIEGLNELIQNTSLDTLIARKQALAAVGSTTNFYLQYQGKNDTELQKQYGQFVHQVMAANYPQWAKLLHMPSLQKYEKIRVGYVSAHLRNHNGAKWVLGWLKNHERQKIEIYCYQTSSIVDQITRQFELSSDFFHHIPDDLEAVCHQIVSDKLHILFFPDIGMNPLITQIAGLRLAPVKCTMWGHPITSGIPTVDYYLSSDLMEPEDAQEHYSEQLFRIPNIGLCSAKPVIPQPTKTRSYFQLRQDAVVYLSCQSLFKYLPQYDYIFAAIAKQIPQAQFAFLSHQSAYINDKFMRRLQRTFDNFGLASEDYCVILPRQDTVGYLNLNLVSDIYLDTFTWSGGNTTLEAIACNLPIVTRPGEFMRGRHSYAILKMLGVTDTIASNEAEYIEIAVKLGLDKEWRESIIKRMVERHSYLYDDKTCVAGVDAFYERVVQEGQLIN